VNNTGSIGGDLRQHPDSALPCGRQLLVDQKVGAEKSKITLISQMVSAGCCRRLIIVALLPGNLLAVFLLALFALGREDAIGLPQRDHQGAFHRNSAKKEAPVVYRHVYHVAKDEVWKDDFDGPHSKEINALKDPDGSIDSPNQKLNLEEQDNLLKHVIDEDIFAPDEGHEPLSLNEKKEEPNESIEIEDIGDAFADSEKIASSENQSPLEENEEEEEKQNVGHLPIQVKPATTHSFAYYRGSHCGYLCEVLKNEGGWKQITKLPELILIRWKSFEKYQSIRKSIINQLGKTANCIGGLASTQFQCREQFISKFGCSMQDLDLQPATFSLSDDQSCKAFQQANSQPALWVNKASHSWLGTNPSSAEVPALFNGTSAVLKKGTKVCKPRKSNIVVQAFVPGVSLKVRTFFVVASTRPLVILFHPGVSWKSSPGLNSGSIQMLRGSVEKISRKDALAKMKFDANPATSNVSKRARAASSFFVAAALNQGLEKKSARFQVFSIDWIIDKEDQALAVDVTGEPMQVEYAGSELAPGMWASLYNTVEKLHVSPPIVLEQLDLQDGWEILKVPAAMNPCTFLH